MLLEHFHWLWIGCIRISQLQVLAKLGVAVVPRFKILAEEPGSVSLVLVLPDSASAIKCQ